VSFGNTLTVNSGTNTLNSGESPSLANYSQNNGLLTGSDNFTVTNSATLTTGTLGGTGILTIAPAATAVFNPLGGNFTLNRGLLNLGSMSWTGSLRDIAGTGSFTNAPGASFSVQISSSQSFSPSFTNQSGAAFTSQPGNSSTVVFSGSFNNADTVIVLS